MNKKHCQYCDLEGHTSFYCPTKPKKSMKSFGPYAARFNKVKRKWYKLNPPDHAGYYFCYLCGKAITKVETELDHVLSRSRHPELRFELSNLKPSCHECNFSKGSREVNGFFG